VPILQPILASFVINITLPCLQSVKQSQRTAQISLPTKNSVSMSLVLPPPNTDVPFSLDKWFHAHPELSYQEENTAAAIVKHLESFRAYEIHPAIGGHGIAAVLKNGPGKTLLLRADIDALPVEEKSGLEYASQVKMKSLDGVEKSVMHACGHDMYVLHHFRQCVRANLVRWVVVTSQRYLEQLRRYSERKKLGAGR
jgi:hypothetical protein